jgi:glycosyltransferase involved in cell wall biosynthesis
MKSSKEMPSLSVAIISRNEKARIARCLESVRAIAREIIIVDSGSTDGTIMIAEAMGARVFSEEWKGFVAQRNSVLEKCTGEWVLFLDCDEVLSETLRNNIAEAIRNDECNGYKLKYVSFFMGRWIKHAWSQDWHTRLIRRGKAVWTGHDVHETLECREPVRKLDGDAYHYTYVNYEQHLSKGIHYATLGARSLCSRDKKIRLYMLIVNPVWSFIKHFVVKRGFLDGFQGFVISVTSMHHNFYKYLIAWEMQNREFIDGPSKSDNQPCQTSSETHLL